MNATTKRGKKSGSATRLNGQALRGSGSSLLTNSDSTRYDLPASFESTIVVFRVVGVGPLLVSSIQGLLNASSNASEKLAAKKTYDDAEQMEKGIHRDEDGRPLFPCVAFHLAMISAVTGRKFGKVSAPGLIRKSVRPAEEFCYIERPDAKQAQPSMDIRMVNVGTMGKKTMIRRVRPCWQPWAMNVALEIDVAVLPQEYVADCLRAAGHNIGVGDYRPEKGGWFGRFRVETK